MSFVLLCLVSIYELMICVRIIKCIHRIGCPDKEVNIFPPCCFYYVVVLVLHSYFCRLCAL